MKTLCKLLILREADWVFSSSRVAEDHAWFIRVYRRPNIVVSVVHRSDQPPFWFISSSRGIASGCSTWKHLEQAFGLAEGVAECD
jgi:hypothetical protein